MREDPLVEIPVPERSTANPSILIIDDVKEIVEELTTMLNLLDMPATGAYSLTGALAILEREPSIRVVSCDIRLSSESGSDLIDLVAERPALAARDLAFLFMTGDAMRFDATSTITGHPVLMKPVQPAELVRALRKLLRKGSPQE